MRRFFGLLLLVATAAAADVPCWYQQPVSDQHSGAIGVARDLDGGSGKPLQYSRHRALAAVADYLGVEGIPARTELDREQSSYQIGEHRVSFADDYRAGGYVYSYAALGDAPSSQQCSVSRCDIDRCQPAWLCEPGVDGRPSLVGTSYRADTLPAQYRLAVNSALRQLQPVFGVDVVAEDRLIREYSSLGRLNLTLSEGQVSARVQSNTLRYLVTDSCWQGEQLFSRVNFPDLQSLTAVPAATWMSEPVTAGFKGAIGSVQGRVASGLLSEKIALAVERGLIELAKSIETEISEELLTIERKGGYYQLSMITQSSQLTLTARVNGIHFNNTPAGISVYAWLVETSTD